MNTHALTRQVRLASAVLVAAGCCSIVALAASAANRPSIAGTWTGSYHGTYTGTFTLHWKLTNSTLVGRINLSNPPGSYGITGSVRGSAIHFGVVGAGATYTGSVSGKSMSGRYKSPGGGGSWSATKS